MRKVRKKMAMMALNPRDSLNCARLGQNPAGFNHIKLFTKKSNSEDLCNSSVRSDQSSGDPEGHITSAIVASSSSKSVAARLQGRNITYLKNVHHIDPKTSRAAQKQQHQGIPIDASILRLPEIHIKAEEKGQQELMGIDLSKAKLEFIYTA